MVDADCEVDVFIFDLFGVVIDFDDAIAYARLPDMRRPGWRRRRAGRLARRVRLLHGGLRCRRSTGDSSKPRGSP